MNAKSVCVCGCEGKSCVSCGAHVQSKNQYKKVEHKHIHCLDCYRQVRNAKQREYRKIKKQKKQLECETCNAKVKSLIEYYGIKGERWHICEKCETKFDEERDLMGQCKNCDTYLDEDMHIFCYTRDTEDMTLCKDCGEDCYDELRADGWVRDDDEGSTTNEDDDGFEDCNVCGYAHHHEDKCPNETTCEHYEKVELENMTFEVK